jgi:4-alpha-glucanotransferase
MPDSRSKRHFRFATRAAGVLLHPTSLASPHGIGDLGREAQRFVDFLHAAGQTWWQMLPIGPTGPGNSPYSALSAFAGSPLLISLEKLADDGLLSKRDLRTPVALPRERVLYPAVTRFKLVRLRSAFQNFVHAGGLTDREFVRFCAQHASWLDAHADYMARRRTVGWAPPTNSSHAVGNAHPTEAALERFLQFQFDRQWTALKRYANDRGVGLIGDLPLFVALESSDVWAHPELFDLDARGKPRTVSGVPPDYFSRSGQLWQHPQYRWPRHAASGFAWWLQRFRRLLALFDAVRIDHFLGFHRVWAVPGRAKTARHGKWVKTPGAALFATLRRKLGPLEIIAEDLGLAVPEAVALRDRCGFPGMRLLHFAFGDDPGDRYNQPHTYPYNCVVYPGTHDNETTVGWFENLRRRQHAAHERARRYLGTSGREIHWDIMRLALQSPANTAIIPVPDLLGLGNEARMNTPATTRGNWTWRLQPGQLTPAVGRRLRELTETYGRLGS